MVGWWLSSTRVKLVLHLSEVLLVIDTLRSTRAPALQGRHADELVATLSISLVRLAGYWWPARRQHDVAFAVRQLVVWPEKCSFLAVHLGTDLLKQLAANNKVVVASVAEDKVRRDLVAVKY